MMEEYSFKLVMAKLVAQPKVLFPRFKLQAAQFRLFDARVKNY